MKVTGQQPPIASELTPGKSREAGRKKGRVEQGPEQRVEGERTAGNHTSLTLNRIREAIRNTPDVRGQRVEALKERIRSGSYKPDAERVAEKLLNESLREDLEKP